MSVQLIGYGGYFTRIGTWIGEFNRVAALYGSALTNGFESIWVQYSSSDQAAAANLPSAVSAFQQSPNSYLSALQSGGQQSSVLQVNDDTPLIPFNFTQSVLTLVGQMKTASASINRPTLTSTVAAGGSNKGNANFYVSTINAYGDPLDMTYAETITLTCTSATPSFGETFQALGIPAVPFTASNWPQGSGCNTTIGLTNPANNTLVTDGVFANWTGVGNNTPVNWTIVNGVAGTQITQGTSPVRTGFSFNANIVSDGSSHTQLAQQVTLQPNTVYGFSIQAKMSSLDVTGQFSIYLSNAAGGTALTNDVGSNLSLTVGTNGGSGVGTGYSNFTVFFATPRQLPTTVFINYGFTTAPSAAKTLLLDLAAGQQATQFYNQGPYVYGVSNSNPNATNDTYTATFTNSLGTQSFARGCQRVLNLPNLGPKVYFPSSVSPTISDSLVSNP